MFDVFEAKTIKELDKLTLKEQNISSLKLMERAAELAWKSIIPLLIPSSKILVWCGKGNNAGDGWVIARLAFEQGYEVEVITTTREGTNDAESNKNRFVALGGVVRSFESRISVLKEYDFHIDAVLGIGIEGNARGEALEMIDSFNLAEGIKVAIDVPSGIVADQFHQNGRYTFSDHIISFHGYKKAFLSKQFYENQNPIISILNIGLVSNELYGPIYYGIFPGSFPKRNKFDYKGTFHHTLIVGGGIGKGGAAILSAGGALNSGTGWCTVATVESNVHLVTSKYPECMTLPLSNEVGFPTDISYDHYNVIAIGPGLGQTKWAEHLVDQLISLKDKKFVLDADAIRLLAKSNEKLCLLEPKSSVFTPHLGELKALIGAFEGEEDMLNKSQEWVDKYGQYLIIKGPYSFVISPHQPIQVNYTGNPGLAKAGSGDVLTGMIAGMIARNDLDIKKGINWGVFLHGSAADIAVSEYSEESLLPSVLIKYISTAILSA